MTHAMRIKKGDKYAELVYNAFSDQIGKTVGGCAVARKGRRTGSSSPTASLATVFLWKSFEYLK